VHSEVIVDRAAAFIHLTTAGANGSKSRPSPRGGQAAAALLHTARPHDAAANSLAGLLPPEELLAVALEAALNRSCVPRTWPERWVAPGPPAG